MRLSGHMNSIIDPELLDLRNVMEYIVHHTHETIIYPRSKKLN